MIDVALFDCNTFIFLSLSIFFTIEFNWLTHTYTQLENQWMRFVSFCLFCSQSSLIEIQLNKFQHLIGNGLFFFSQLNSIIIWFVDEIKFCWLVWFERLFFFSSVCYYQLLVEYRSSKIHPYAVTYFCILFENKRRKGLTTENVSCLITCIYYTQHRHIHRT